MLTSLSEPLCRKNRGFFVEGKRDFSLGKHFDSNFWLTVGWFWFKRSKESGGRKREIGNGSVCKQGACWMIAGGHAWGCGWPGEAEERGHRLWYVGDRPRIDKATREFPEIGGTSESLEMLESVLKSDGRSEVFLNWAEIFHHPDPTLPLFASGSDVLSSPVGSFQVLLLGDVDLGRAGVPESHRIHIWNLTRWPGDVLVQRRHPGD